MESRTDAFKCLDARCLQNVFSYLRGCECARFACTAKLWSEASKSDGLWSQFIAHEFPLEASKLQSRTGKFKEAYQQLYSLTTRAQAMWRNIEGWCSNEAPWILHSLNKGASDEDLQSAEKKLGLEFPTALKAVYREHNGQELNYDRCLDDEHDGIIRPDQSVFAGLFGGYSFYNHFVCTRMLPLHRMVRWTRWMRESQSSRELGANSESNPDEQYWVIFAASYVFNKVFFMDTRDASIHVWTQDRIGTMRAVPQTTQTELFDGLIRWLEEYSRRLQNGVYRVAPLLNEGDEQENSTSSRGICLFPADAPGRSSAVTTGIKVQTSSLLAPELSAVPTEGRPTFTIAYSVEFSLLPCAEQEPHRVVRRCKLSTRHWSILDANGNEASTVTGPAVVGRYPDLKSGSAAFHYQSCTRQHELEGAMEGHFIFIDTSLSHAPVDHSQPPVNNQEMKIKALCPRFSTSVPDTIF